MPKSSEKSSARSAPKVYSLAKAARCFACDAKLDAGSIVKLVDGKDEKEVQCQTCAGLAAYVQLPAGNAKMTRLAPKFCPTYCVIMRWSELWKCYERTGLLIEQEALEKLKTECS